MKPSYIYSVIGSLTLLAQNFAVAALNDTGITTCSDATQNGLPCPVAGFPGQDAEYGTNSFNFTKLDANGNAMPVTATNHTCVKDNVTGLMWEVKTDDGGLRDKDWSYTWYDSNSTDGNFGTSSGSYCGGANTGRCDTEKFVADVNATNLCGHNDWRVPNPYELASIVDYSVYKPSINDDFFPYTSNNSFWTNATYAADSRYSWSVHFGDGLVHSYGYRSNGRAVRLVRAGQLLLPFSFTNKGDGTVTESTTGLMWAKCSVGQVVTDCSGNWSVLTWQQALQAADSSTLAGYSDWRLPHVKELQTLVDYTTYSPSINAAYFPNTPHVSYWSYSPYAVDSSESWHVYFSHGLVDQNYRNNTIAVRLVRNISTPTVTKPTVVTNAPSVVVLKCIG